MASQVNVESTSTAGTVARIRRVVSMVGDFLGEVNYSALFLGIVSLIAWGGFAWVGWADLPAPVALNAQLPQNAEVVASDAVSSSGFQIRTELTDLLSRASESGDAVLVTYGVLLNACQIEYWLPRGDGLVYYYANVVTDPPSDWSRRGLNLGRVSFEDGTFAMCPGRSGVVVIFCLIVALVALLAALCVRLDAFNY